MEMPEWISDTWAKLNTDRQKRAEDFVYYLLEQQKKEDAKEVKPFIFGALKGQIKVYDNFDDPLPEFEEYM